MIWASLFGLGVGIIVGSLFCLLFYGLGHDHGVNEMRHR